MYSTEACVPMTVRLVEMAGDVKGARAGWQECVVSDRTKWVM